MADIHKAAEAAEPLPANEFALIADSYSCDDQFTIAESIAANIGYRLVAETSRASAPAPAPGEAEGHIETDPLDPTREYIPVAGWEFQTKGRGSTYRLLNKATGDRRSILAGDILSTHDFVTQFAKDAFALIRRLTAEKAKAEGERDDARDWHTNVDAELRKALARAEAAEQRAEAAAKERGDLLAALGFRRDATMHQVILDDAAGLRPAMVEARRQLQLAECDAGNWWLLMQDAPPSEFIKKLWEQRKAERARADALAQECEKLRGQLALYSRADASKTGGRE